MSIHFVEKTRVEVELMLNSLYSRDRDLRFTNRTIDNLLHKLVE